MPLRHTPYRGSKTPFSIGLSPLDPETWIEPDEYLHAHLEEKARLLRERYEDVVAVEPGSEAAQQEVLDLIVEHVSRHFPDRYDVSDDRVRVLPDGPDHEHRTWEGPPLELAARLVQEDLCLMRADDDGHRLVAAVVCFPSSWSLAEKFGRPLSTIHAPVPGLEGRMSAGIDRIFDNLKVDQPVWRLNWAIMNDAVLHHPARHSGEERHELDPGRDLGEQLFMRVERQTLRRLPASGNILFTIRIHVDQISELGRHPDSAILARGLREQILGLTEAQLEYKGLVEIRDQLTEYLAGLEAEKVLAVP